MNLRRGSVLLASLLAGVVSLAGCEGPPDGASENPNGPATVPGGPGPAANGDVGSFTFSLTLGGGFRINQVSYDVSGNGFHKAGTVDVSGSTSLSSVVTGIPLGTGYALQLTAQDTANKLMGCAGSTTFDLPNPTTVQVPVHMTCREVPAAPPVTSVPLPPWARLAIAAMLLACGAAMFRRRLS
jgi:hypothetical protein